jgi:4-amino-4-deoxy-L-arabinose transferase-like glycosyltransferase
MMRDVVVEEGPHPNPLPAYRAREQELQSPRAKLLWFLSLAVLLAGLALPPVRRAQESRVLETAREMLMGTSGLHDWLVPHVNGHVRLEKPPLAYWLTAISFQLFGVNEFAGRLPNALAGWLTLAVVYRLGWRALSPPVGFLAAACLSGTYYFFRYTRFAETDVLATLFVSAAALFIWRAADTDGLTAAFVRDAHLSALAIALAVLAKGPPAAFVAIFFAALLISTRKWRVLWRWLLTGAPLTIALISLPWFLYVRSLPEWPVVQHELAIALMGGEHQEPFYYYFPQLLLATAPWCGFVVVALVGAAMRFRRDARVDTLLLWFVGTFVALCIARQRQPHYLIPLLPPLALLAGWWINRAMNDESDRPLCRTILVVTLIVFALAAIAASFVAPHIRGTFRPDDVFFAVVGVVSALLVWLTLRAKGLSRGMFAFAIVCPLLLFGVGVWAVSLNAVGPRYVAALVRERFGPSRMYYDAGPSESLPLVWAMRTVLPPLRTPDDVQLALLEHPDLVAISVQRTSNRTPSPPPEGLIEDMTVRTSDETYTIYVAPPSRAP